MALNWCTSYNQVSCLFCFSMTYFHNKGLTSTLLPRIYLISVFPNDGIREMTLFLTFYISPPRFSIRLSFVVFSCFYKLHIPSVHNVRKVRAYLVRNSYVINDANSFTKPGGFLIPNSVIYRISPV